MADEPVEKIATGGPSGGQGPNLAPNPFGGFGAVPQMTGGMTFKEVAQSGLRAFAGYIQEEFLPQLSLRQAPRIYREMMDNSPVIGGLITAINSTIRKPEWRTVPSDDSPEAQEMADFADSLRSDMSSTWEDVIVENMSMVGYGFAPHEIVYKRRNGRNPGGDKPTSQFDDGFIGWRKLPIRGQDTILKWFLGPNGELQGLTQQPYTGFLIDLPVEKMLLFRPSQHKDNPQGRSVLRSAYRPYYLSKRIEEQEAIMFERLNGIPVITMPSAVLDAAASGDPKAMAVVQMYQKVAINLRVDEQMGVTLPSDPWMGPNGPTSIPLYDLKLVTAQSSKATVSSSDTINRLEVNMLISAMADFLALGHGAHGSQELGLAKQDMFAVSCEGYLNSTAAVYNRYALPRLWALNGFDPDLMPTYEPDMAQRVDLDVLGNYLLRLSQAGMPLFPNPDLESAVLDAAGLPDIEDADAVALPTQDAPIDDKGPNMAKSSMGRMLFREMARKRMGRVR